MSFSSSIAVVIPSYKAEKYLGEFLPILLKTVPSSQVYVVNDGVFDDTEEVAKSFGVNYLEHKENRGKGAAISTAFRSVPEEFSWIVTMDADGQHSVDDLEKFTEVMNSSTKTGIVVGSRPRKLGEMPFARIFSNSSTSKALSILCKQKIEDTQCGYRAYSRELFSHLNCRYSRFEMESEVLLRASNVGYKIASIPIKTIYGDEESNISHIKDTLRWMRAVISTVVELNFGKKER